MLIAKHVHQQFKFEKFTQTWKKQFSDIIAPLSKQSGSDSIFHRTKNVSWKNIIR